MESKGFQIIEGFVKVGLLVLISLGIIIYVFIKSGGKQIINNWQTHKDNPMIMPIAGAFGKDTKNNAQGVFFSSFKTHFSFLMQPIQYIMKLISSILGKLMGSINLFRTIMKPIRQFFTQATSSFYDKINEFSIMIVYFFGKMRNLLRRLSSTFRLLIYTLQAIHLTMKSVWNGPIGEVSKDWAYAFDTLRGFFCFHGETLIKLQNNIVKPIKELRIGDKIVNSTGFDIVLGMAVTKISKNKLYQIGNNLVTGSHLVFNNGIWVRAETIGTKNKDPENEFILVYCPITEQHTFTLLDGLLVRDFTELEDNNMENNILNHNINRLNNTNIIEKYNDKQLIGEPGVSGNSFLNLPCGGSIQAKDVKIETQLELGKVLGIVTFQLINKATYRINNNLQITSRQLVEINHKWGLYQTNKQNVVIDDNTSVYYSFLTDTGKYSSGEIILADILDGQSIKDINYTDNIIEKQVNN